MVHPPTLFLSPFISPPACYFCKIIIIEKSVRKSFKPHFNVLASDKISDMGDWEGVVLAQILFTPGRVECFEKKRCEYQ